MNRAQRRVQARSAGRSGVSLPPICPPGQHTFGEVAGRIAGKIVTRRVVCSRCRRLIEQVLDEQPEELARFRAWMDAGEPDA